MTIVNENFALLSESYLFSEIAERVRRFHESTNSDDIIRLGIGDVTQPLCPAAIEAMHRAVDDMASSTTFHGYGPEQGYQFLRDAISQNDYRARGIDIASDEIFVSDGAKSDTGNIGDIFDICNSVAMTDPVYPVYVDTNVMSGRAGANVSGRWQNIEMMPCTFDNGFIPELPKSNPALIYLCFPNNPTGTVLTKAQLKPFVDYALEHKSIILFDSAYEAFITEDDVPHSIFEIEGAKKCAIEFRSYSKTAGFTGIRCGYTVVPRELIAYGRNGEQYELNKLWKRRQCTKFNGASYISQRGAESIYSEEGKKQVKSTIDYYLRNAKILLEGCQSIGLQATGGISSPYVWISSNRGVSSWQLFDLLLNECHLVGTPGVGFGPSGEGCFRLTAFNTYEKTIEAVNRLKRVSI